MKYMLRNIKFKIFIINFSLIILLNVSVSAADFIAISNLLFDRTSHASIDIVNDKIRQIIKNNKEKESDTEDLVGKTKWINSKQANAIRIVVQKHCNTMYQGAGGSAANTIAGLSALGAKVTIIGALGNDEFAKLYKKSLTKRKISYIQTPARNPKSGSGTCTVIITKDDKGLSERTMLTNLGVSSEIILSNENIAYIEKAKCLIVEGYLFSPENTYKSIYKAAKHMKDNGKKVAVTLSADFCVKDNFNKINAFIDAFADIVVGNETEAQILTNTKSPQDAASCLQKRGFVGAVTCGNKGAYVFDKNEICFISSPKVNNNEVVDTTGAGDQFFAGFLYKLFNNHSIQEAGTFGAYYAGEVIKQWGAQPHKLSYKHTTQQPLLSMKALKIQATSKFKEPTI